MFFGKLIFLEFITVQSVLLCLMTVTQLLHSEPPAETAYHQKLPTRCPRELQNESPSFLPDLRLLHQSTSVDRRS